MRTLLRKKCALSVALWLLGLLACAVSPQQGNPEGEPVSLVALLANPEKYDGKRVWTEGYSAIGHYEGALFLTSESARDFTSHNGIRLNSPESVFDEGNLPRWIEKRVIVQGVFHAPSPGYDLRRGINEISKFIGFEPKTSKKTAEQFDGERD